MAAGNLICASPPYLIISSRDISYITDVEHVFMTKSRGSIVFCVALNSVTRYLKKDLVAHCETSLSLAALEHARIRAVAQACSSLTANVHSSDDMRTIQVKPIKRKEE